MSDPISIPLRPLPRGRTHLHLDVDAPDYFFDPGFYVTTALAYDSLAGPACVRDADGVASPDYRRMQPRLAKSWTEDPGGSWVVALRDATSAYGNVLAADDVVWAFDKTRQNVGNPGFWRWREVAGLEQVTAVAHDRVRYHLRAAMELFPNWLLLTWPNIVDSKAAADHASDADPWATDWLSSHTAGHGPYHLVSADTERIRFEPRADYWMGSPGAQDVEVVRVPARADAFDLLDSAAPTVFIGPTTDELHALLARDDLRVERVWAGHASVEIDFSSPPFDDIRVRHALSLATPYHAVMRDGFLGLARPWRSPVKRDSQWYDDAAWNYETDIGRARALLKDAGYGDGFATTLHIRSRPDCDRVAAILQVAWREIGVEIEVKPIERVPLDVSLPLTLRMECAHTFCEPLYDIAHDYAIIDSLFPPPGGQKGIGPWQPRWVRNDAIIDRLREAIVEPDRASKRKLASQLQGEIVGFASSIFLAETQHAFAVNRKVAESFAAPDSRFYQAIQYQNNTSNYLSSRVVRPSQSAA